MSLILDPDMRVIDKNHQIFVLHPGDGKRFYQDFQHHEAVFLDLPGISFDRSPDIEDEETRKKLRMARSIGGWHKAGRPSEKMPSRDPATYSASVEGREAPRFMREIHTLYVEAKPGDLVIIPGPGYNSAVLFGEILEPFDPDFRVDSVRYMADLIPARRIRFLQTNQQKYEFGRRAITLMQNRQALIRINDDEDRHEFYEHAYGDYVWGDVSGNYMEITEQVVDQKDLTDVLFMTNYFGAMYVALKAGELERFSSLQWHIATTEYYNRELFGEISIEVHSPGFFGRPMRDAAIAGFISAMTALAAHGATASEIASLQVANSANERVSVCDQQLQDDIRSTVKMVTNAHLWWDDVCKAQKAASERTGLKTKAKVLDKH